LEAAGKFAEAQKPARDIWAMRSRVQGAAHWQTADAKRRLRSLEQRAALSPDAQAELVQADKHFAEAKALNEKVQYAEAERLHRQALEVYCRLLGEHHPDTATSYNEV